MRAWLVAAGMIGLFMGARPAAAQETGLAVGARAPVVVVKDLDGQAVDLGRYIGTKPVLLEFWATWCEVCKALMPTVRAARNEFGNRVEFFGINVTVNQTPERVRKYVATEQPPFRTLYDEEGVSTRAYEAPTTSYIVIIDRTGKVAYTGTGASQDLAAALRTVIAQ
ncbi:MAG TPA: TlpA disulfide reductase family protein [Gemmatimonadales bacterium]|nr:TlpA disulfide reductase family protein [Gemmatimonadales bacterium]